MTSAQVEHALGDLGDALEEGGAGDRPAGPPVGQRPDVVELWARPAEEPQSPTPPDAPDEGVEAVDHDASRGATSLVEDPPFQIGRVGERLARPGVEDPQVLAHLRSKPCRRYLRGDVSAGLASAETLGEERPLDGDDDALTSGHPHDVVAWKEATKEVIEVGDSAARPHRRLLVISDANWKPSLAPAQGVMVGKEAVMVVVIVLSVVVWLSIPPVLSRLMARHGYDGTSYLVLGALFGPLAIVLAVTEVFFDVPEPGRILEAGRTGHGDLSVLVVVGGEPTTALPTTALAGFGPRLRRRRSGPGAPEGWPPRR